MKRPPPMEKYLTVSQVAELLQVSEKSVYRLTQRGTLPGFKAGGSWRFRALDIDAWVATQIRERRGEKARP